MKDMKQIFMLNNSQGVIGLFLGLKSRITSTKPLLTMLALLMVCLFGVNVEAWGLEQYVTVTDFDNSTKYDGTGLNHITSSGFSNKVNHVTFTIAGVAFSDSWGDNRLDYSSQSKNSELSSPITWEADPNYDVCVTKVLMGVRGYQSVISPKTANAYLTDGTTKTGTQDCKTNGTGTKTFDISATEIYSPLSLVKSTGGNSTTYKIPTITFTYKVTHKRYQYGFDAVLGGVMNSSYGTATATGGGTVYNDLTETTASKQVTFTATPTNTKDYKFVGWYSDAKCTNQVSKENPYTPTLENSTAGSVNTLTLYAKFDVKGTPVVTCDIEDEYEIGHEPIDLQTLWTREGNGAITYSIVPNSFVASGTNNTGAVEPALSEGRYLSLGQAGTLKLKMVIDADGDEYLARTVTKDITINKITNTLYVNGSATYNPTMQMGKNLAVTLTATNTDYTGSPIQLVKQTAGDNTVAVFDYTQNTHSGTVHSKYKKDVTATWSIHQDENYKYLAGNNTFSVDVQTASEATDCYVKTDLNTEHKFSDSWETTWNEDNAAGTLRFEACAQAAWTYGLNVYQLIDGNWSFIEYIDHDHIHMAYTQYSYQLNQRAKGVKFEQTGTLNRWVQNVYVTRASYLNAENLTIDKTSTNNPVYPSDGTGVGTLTIDYSLANGGDLKIYNDNAKFTLSSSTISNVDCKTGTANINIQYQSAVAGTDVAHLVIYNDVYRKEVTVTGITSKRDQEVHWEIGDALRVGTQTENAAWVTIGSKVSYSSSNTTLLEVVEGKLVAKAEGEVTITATAPGNGEYNDVEDQKTITITNDLIQSIVWEQNFLRLKLGGANQTLNAYAVSDVEGCTTDRARLITYESSDESVVKVINSNQLQIVGAGQAVLTARQAGGVDADGHKYMAVSAEKAVIVRDPNAPCDNYLYIQPQENKWDCGWNHANRQYKEFIIDNLDEPSTLYLQYKGEYKTVVFDYFYGTMHVDEWYDGDWHEVPNGNLGTPTIGTYQTLNTTLQRKTTKVRIRTNDGVGYHYFKDCKIGQSRYIETPTTLNAFESKVGQVVNQQLTVRYNNITGPVTLSLGSNNSKFSLSQQSIDGDCGDKGTVNVTVSYLPTVEADEQELLTISDGTTTLNVTLHGVATKTSRHIDWNIPETNDVHTVDVVELGAQALTDVGNTTAGNVFYAISSSSPSGVGSVAGNNLTFAKAGTIVVTANTVNDARYNDAVAVSKTYNVALTPTTISTMPVLAEVKSGTAAGEIELTGWQVTNTVNGGVVEGTLAITSADLTNVGTNTVTLTFTPSNTDMYSGCTGTTTVTVNKATSVATPSAANIVYGQKVSESVLSNEGTEGTWAWTDAKAEDVLAAGTYNDLAVHFTPTSGNYIELDATVTLTVEKANPVVTAQATAITYGQAISASELSTATGNISGTWAWAVDEEQVLSIGDHVLKANFTSTNANYNDLSNVDVTLTVNKIEKLEVPVALSFCAGGEVTFHDNTYTEAGEYQIEAEGATRDTIYNVTVTKLQPTTGTDSKTITVGASESWNGINLSGYAVGSHEVVFHTTNAAGCDSTVTLTLTVVPLSNIFTNAEGDGDWGNANNWESGIVPTSDPDIIVTGALEIKESITVGSLTIEQTGSVSVISGGTLTVNGVSETRAEYGDVHVLNDGAIHLSNSADLQVRDFTLDAKLGDGATSAASGQVSGDSTKLHVNSVAYFQLSFDPSGAIDYGWYDFTVPFPVNISGGIERVNSSADKVMVCGQDFLLMEDDEASFVNGGKGWRQISSGVLMPGKLYTITFDETVNQNTFRFAWNGQGELTNGDSFTAQYLTGSDASRNGWNAIGNAMLRHGYVAGDYKIQAYNHTDNVYEIIYDPKTFAVGTAFFIQVEEAGNIDWKAAEATPGRPIYAPQRVARNIDEFRISLRDEATDAVNDVLFFSASEEATEAYVIGHDLLKKGIPTEAKKAQMWATKRGKNLCDVEGHMMNNKASSDLNFFVPKAGSYELAIDAAPEDATLYLTYNGRAIWNLSMSAYEFDLEKGTTEGYGLRIVASEQTTTDIENGGLLNDENGVRKVLIDDVIYIVTPEGKMYDIVGKGIKF